MEVRRCGRCDKEKSLEENFTFTKARQKYQSFCKACNKKYQRKHYLANKQGYLDKQQQRRDEWAEWWVEVKQDLKCESCTENHVACLDFHHLDRNAKLIELSLAVRRTWSKQRILGEMEKCVVLCSNCHRKRHWAERVAISSNG